MLTFPEIWKPFGKNEGRRGNLNGSLKVLEEVKKNALNLSLPRSLN